MAVAFVSWFAVALLAAAAGGMLLSRDWRWSLGWLAAQYLAAFLLVTQHWPIGMAAVKLVTGWMATAALGMTRLGLAEPEAANDTFWPQGRTFRLIGAAIVAVIALTTGPRLETFSPGVGVQVFIGSLLLMGTGLLMLGITSGTLRVIIGLLAVLCGFEILYAALESSILVAALLAVANLGLSLTGSYLLVNSLAAEDAA